MSSSIMGIINNEKYKGDILLGKTFTVDPISKRRLENLGRKIGITYIITMNRLFLKKCLREHRRSEAAETETVSMVLYRETGEIQPTVCFQLFVGMWVLWKSFTQTLAQQFKV